MGRPVLERGRVIKTAVVLGADQAVALDRLALDIRAASGRAMDRSTLLRGIVAGVLASGVDLTGAMSEDEIADVVATKLRR